MGFLTTPNVRILNIIYGISLAVACMYVIATFIVATKECALKSGCSDFYKLFGIYPGEGLFILSLGFFWIGVFCLGLFSINKNMSPLTYGACLATSANVAITTFAITIWANAKSKAIVDAVESMGSVDAILDSQFLPIMRAVMLAACVLFFLQFVFILLMLWWSDKITSDSENSLYSDVLNDNMSSYQAPDADMYQDQDDHHYHDEHDLDNDYDHNAYHENN